jgi:hypothetical protein
VILKSTNHSLRVTATPSLHFIVMAAKAATHGYSQATKEMLRLCSPL